jgi:salicylate hydroxylase
VSAARPIAIAGAGISGLAAAIALHRAGFEVEVYEQAARFGRIGAAINLCPNAVKVLDGLGVGPALRDRAHIPAFRNSLVYDTAKETSRTDLTDSIARYGAPPIMTHRADLLDALEGAVPAGCVHLGHRLVGIEPHDEFVTLVFANGARREAAGLIGADGIHSVVRAHLFGAESPTYSGMTAYRGIVPKSRLPDLDFSGSTKWWGPTLKSMLVTFSINRGEEVFIFSTKEQPEADRESWSAEAEVAELRAAFADYHPDAQRTLAAIDKPLKTALYVRESLPRWGEGRITLLGDACHPMLPFMAQGAAMGLESVAVLQRCLEASGGDIAAAFDRYQRTRLERASSIQQESNRNNWLRFTNDADRVYGFDAWTTPLAPAAADAKAAS